MIRIMRCSTTLPCRSEASSVFTSTLASRPRLSVRINCAGLLLQPGVTQVAVAKQGCTRKWYAGAAQHPGADAERLCARRAAGAPGGCGSAADPRSWRLSVLRPRCRWRCLFGCTCICCSCHEKGSPLRLRSQLPCQRQYASHAVTLQACAAQLHVEAHRHQQLLRLVRHCYRAAQLDAAGGAAARGAGRHPGRGRRGAHDPGAIAYRHCRTAVPHCFGRQTLPPSKCEELL